MDAKLLATIIAVAKKEASANSVDVSNLQHTVEDQLQEFHKRSPILETPTFSVVQNHLYCKWPSGLNLDLGNIIGPQGPPGIQGVQGKTGTTGVDGVRGTNGLNGSNGRDGIDGRSGKDGTDGAVGLDGHIGAVGHPGEQGRTGEQGVPGKDGDRGSMGLPGLNATDGDAGLDGVGVDKAYVDDNHHLTIKLTSGKVIDAGYVRGPAGVSSGKGGRVTGGYSGGSASIPGPPGKDGTNGQSANSIIYVTSPDQLSGTLQSNKLYFIDGTVDMESTQITVPPGGLSIGGAGFDVSCLTSTEDNYTMFINTAESYSGNVYLTSLDVIVSGTSSQVFNLDAKENGSNIEFNSTNFVTCTSLGEASNFRQGLARNVGWVSITEGLTLSGTWSGGFAAFDSIIVGAPMSGVLFRAGTNLTLGGSFRSNINALSLGTNGGVFCDFSPSNILLDAGFALSGLRTNPLSNTLPNMPATSTKALIKDCVGIGNTYPGAAHIPVADSVITITTQNTLTQITGAMTLVEPYWFSTENTNGLRSDCAQAVEGRADGTMSFSGQANTEISVQLRHFIAATSSYENVGPEYEATINGGLLGTLASNVSFGATVTMQQGDRAEVWIKNRSGTNDITLKSGGQFEVLGR